MDWQPIETAAEDGALLGYDPSQHPFERITTIVHYNGVGWQSAFDPCGQSSFKPTHWAPLHEPRTR